MDPYPSNYHPSSKIQLILEDQLLIPFGGRSEKQGSQSQDPQIPSSSPPPSFEHEYAEMMRLAIEDDDFKKVLDLFSLVSWKEIYPSTRTRRVLQEAFVEYTSSQLQMASAFAGIGRFDDVDRHLSNACKAYRVGPGQHIDLTPTIDPGRVKRVIDQTLENSNPELYVQRATTSAAQGDPIQTRRYIGLSLRTLELHGLIEAPSHRSDWSVGMNSRQKMFFRMSQELGELLTKAYNRAVSKNIGEAVGHAVNGTGGYCFQKNSREIETLLMDAVDHTVPPSRRSEAYGVVIDFCNNILPIVMQELIACCKDQDHPLRQIFTPRRDPPPYGPIRGCERIEVSTRALVPRAFYESLVQETGIPLIIHPFFTDVALRYAHSG
ncbi:MAG TPA: hypothetical protein VJH22_06995 [Candidatus Nanoarchaeia archaeon]|nr:hypothetical protein [Candidatus Nanoarchaeia archaeon]